MYKYSEMSLMSRHSYGLATCSRLPKILGLFCKRALWKKRYSAKETYNFEEPTTCSHPICVYWLRVCMSIYLCTHICVCICIHTKRDTKSAHMCVCRCIHTHRETQRQAVSGTSLVSASFQTYEWVTSPHTCTYIYIYICICICVYLYICCHVKYLNASCPAYEWVISTLHISIHGAMRNSTHMNESRHAYQRVTSRTYEHREQRGGADADYAPHKHAVCTLT